MPRLCCIFHSYYLTVPVLSYCFAPNYFGKIQPPSVILSTSPCASSLHNKHSDKNNTIETISPDSSWIKTDNKVLIGIDEGSGDLILNAEDSVD